MNWRYVRDGQALGPLDTAALQAMFDNGTLSGETLVWKEGMTNWVAARSLPEFKIDAPAVDPANPVAPTPPSAAPSIPPIPGTSETADIEKNKIFAVLAYIGILFLVPLLAAPNSKFARYHTNQGVVLFIAGMIVTVGSTVMAFVPFVSCIAGIVIMAASVAWLVLMILGIINAASGQCKPLPWIGHYELIK